MSDENNIYIKLEIEKNPENGQLIIMTRFDRNAPNFSQDKDGFNWCPTNAERDFLNEALDLMLKKK
jgi:hypothetical protein